MASANCKAGKGTSFRKGIFVLVGLLYVCACAGLLGAPAAIFRALPVERRSCLARRGWRRVV